MKVFYWEDFVNNDLESFFLRGSAVTTGCFDGPHKGHEILFKRVLSEAEKRGLLKGIITYSKPVAYFKHSETFPGEISTVSQRISFFEKYGFDFVVLIDFSEQFSKIIGTDFLQTLKEKCNMKFLAEGTDFKCGNKGSCGVNEIKSYSRTEGFDVCFENLVLSDGKRVSSTDVRTLISRGMFNEVKKLLSFDFELFLEDVPFEKSGNTFVYKRKDISQVLPLCGLYDVFVNTSVRLRSCLEVSSENILVELPFNKISRIQSIIFINKE